MSQPPPQRHLDRFSRFAQLTRVPDTYTQTTLRATSVAVGRVRVQAMRPNNKDFR